MSGIVNGDKQNLEQRQLAQAMQELGRQIPIAANLEGIADLERFNREMITFKQATERKLEELSRFKASAEEQLDSLQKEMRELKEKLEQKDEQEEAAGEEPELQLLEDLQDSTVHKRPLLKKIREKLEQKDEQEEAAGEEPELQLVEDLQDSTVHKRPLLKKIRGFFRWKSLKKRKKKKKKKRGPYEQSDLPGNEAEETLTERRHFRRHDEFTASQTSFAESKASGSYRRREDSNKSSRVSIEIALPKRTTHSGSSLAIHYSFNEESEVFEELREPIKIDKHPKSQTAKEGSKVKFKCKGQGKSTELSYQWFKDGELLPNEDAPILVLDPVRLRDFGYYVCHVSYHDFFGEDSKSSRAKLVVTPDSQSGMRLKRLAELDFNTTEKVCVLLQNKTSVLGGWREVAAAYELESYKIDDVGNSKEPGKSVMEFVMGSRPNLTVYEFCKVLKETHIKRLDVVNILEDHFLAV